MSKVRVVAIYKVSGSGDVQQVAGSEKSRKKKRKSTRGFGIIERGQRRMLEAMQVFADESLDRHNRSSRRRRDGWLRDLPKNNVRSSRKAFKKLRKFSIL